MKKYFSIFLIFSLLIITNKPIFANEINKKDDCSFTFIDDTGTEIRIELKVKGNKILGKQFENGVLVSNNEMIKGSTIVRKHEDGKHFTKDYKEYVKKMNVKRYSYDEDYENIGSMSYRVDGSSIDVFLNQNVEQTTCDVKNFRGKVIDLAMIMVGSFNIGKYIAVDFIKMLAYNSGIYIVGGWIKNMGGIETLAAECTTYNWKIVDTDTELSDTFEGKKYVINESNHSMEDFIVKEGYAEEDFDTEEFRDMAHMLVIGTINNPINIY